MDLNHSINNIVLYSLIILCITFLLKKINSSKQLFPKEYNYIINTLKSRSVNYKDIYFDLSLYKLFNIPIELRFLKLLLDNMYIIFFILGSIFLSKITASYPIFIPAMFSIQFIGTGLIFVFSITMLALSDFSLQIKFFITILVLISCIYIHDSNPYLIFYWLINTFFALIIFCKSSFNK